MNNDLFGEVLSDMANGPKLTGYAEMTGSLMRRLCEKGMTLEELCDKRIMKRSRRTLEAHARRFELAFPDYIPMKLRPKKEKKIADKIATVGP